jgi:hypothetical protein
MDNVTKIPYGQDLIGGLSAHLKSLQGYDVMALELLQNADDAKATKIIFDICDDGLRVWNSGVFSYCGDLAHECTLYKEKDNKTCDFHNLIVFQKKGKSGDSDNIGRFGIGFASTYQITDNPEVISNGIQLRFNPLDVDIEKKDVPNTKGTDFFFPWAFDANSATRIGLLASNITGELIEQVCSDSQTVFKNALIFLKHIQYAEVKRNGKLRFTVELERSDDRKDLIVTYRPKNISKQYLILESNIKNEEKKKAFLKFPSLERQNRKDNVSVAIRVDKPDSSNGLLYAFLPTRQSTGIPLHVNADFFPTSSRKSLIFDGSGQDKYWNILLIHTSAKIISENLELLRDEIGHIQLWNIINSAFEVSKDTQLEKNFPDCFKYFWNYINKEVEKGCKIFFSSEGRYERFDDIFFGANWNENEKNVFNKIGGKFTHNDLNLHQKTFKSLGVNGLKIKDLLPFLETDGLLSSKDEVIDNNKLNDFYRPVWSLINNLLMNDNTLISKNIERLKSIPLIVSTNLKTISIDMLYASIFPVTNVELAKAFILLDYPHDDLFEYLELYKLVDCFELKEMVKEMVEAGEGCLPSSRDDLRSFYSLIPKLDNNEYENSSSVYENLKELPIWRTDSGFYTLNESLLPGGFDDPTGEAKLLNRLYLSPAIEEFLKEKLEIKKQTIKEYVRKVLPRVFDDSGPRSTKEYQELIKILAKDNSLLDDTKIMDLLKETAMIPNMEGGWKTPENIYFKTKYLSGLFGDNLELWVNKEMIPKENSVEAFLKSLGVLSKPHYRHIIDKIYNLSQEYNPTADIRKLSENLFYKLSEIYSNSKDKRESIEINMLHTLQYEKTLPIIGDNESWHCPDEIYAPYKHQAFESQADVLDFLDDKKLNKKLLETLSLKFDTDISITEIANHLIHCIDNNNKPHHLLYQELDKRVQDLDLYNYKKSLACALLKDTKCIWVSDRFVSPNQIFYTKQNLGDYAFTIPEKLNQYKSFFDWIGIKDTPSVKGYIHIIQDIVDKYFPHVGPVSTKDKKIYEICTSQIVALCDSPQEEWSNIESLADFNSILNINNSFCFYDDVLIEDSDWYKNYFTGDDFDWLSKLKDSQLLLERLGVKKLSKTVILELDFKDGEERFENEKTKILRGRINLYMRILQDQGQDFLIDLKACLEKIEIISFEKLMVKASINEDSLKITSQAKDVDSFFDKQSNELYLVRPISTNFINIFKPILHILLPTVSDSELIQLAALCDQISGKSIDTGSQYLSELGLKPSKFNIESIDDIDLTSPDVESLGVGQEDYYGVKVKDSPKEEPSNTDGRQNILESKGRESKSSPKNKSTNEPSLTPDTPRKKPKNISKQKTEYNKRLVSYVESKSKKSSDNNNQARKLEIEVLSRKKVLEYEINRGREPIEMSQTNPGYDMESINKDTGEIERFIEIKGTTGSWKNMGVSISSTQFSHAQDKGSNYWLYVVDNVDESYAKVYAIQNPAMKIDKFMFDGGWKAESEESEQELKDNDFGLKVGARFSSELYGEGDIVDIDGNTIEVSFDSEKKNRKMFWNPSSMRILPKE